MKSKVLFSISLLLYGMHAALAQHPTHIGSVPLDKSFHNSLQLLHPDYYYSDDSTIFYSNIWKSYLNNKATHDTINSTALLKSDSLKYEFDLFMKMAEDYFWTNWASKQVNLGSSPPLDSARAYYERHKQKFTVDGEYTFIQGYLSNDKEESSMLQKMKQIAHEFEKTGIMLKDASGPWTINIEQNLVVRNGEFLFTALETTPLGKISESFGSQNFKVFILPLKVKKSSVKQFEEVKALCEEGYLSEQYYRNKAEFIKNAWQKNPIK